MRNLDLHRTPSAAPTWTILLALLTVGGGFGVVAPTAAVGAAAQFHPWLTPGAILPQTTETCSTTGLCPSTVLAAYGFGPLLANATMNGTGQSIAIVDACGDSGIVSDLSTFDTTNHLPAVNLTVYQPQGTPCSNPTGWGVETALDVEWAHVMAPGAAINLIEAASSSNTNLFGAWNYSLVHHLGNAISNSWGGTGACPSNAKTLLSKALSQHVTVLASGGDSGRWGSGATLGAQQPADCQNILTVGGTTLNVHNVSGAYTSESAWSGSGGGYVPRTTEPTYQKSTNLSDKFAELAKPDVSAVANPSTGVWVYTAGGGGWLVVGGTSVACPIWAGFVADVNDWRAANHFAALGWFDSFLYTNVYGPHGGLANYTATFHDVTTGSNGWSAGTGFDAATGLGSFRGYALANLLANASAA